MNRFERRRAMLKAQGRCVQCRVKLPDACPTVNCFACHTAKVEANRARRPPGTRMAAKQAAMEAQVAKVVETAPTLTVVEQATLLGVTVDRIYNLRAIARRRGHYVPVERGGNQGQSAPASRRWAELDAAMATSCEVCGLRGDHECIQGDALARPGAGRIFPDCR